MLIKLLARLLRMPAFVLRSRREGRVMPLLEPAVAAFNDGRFDEAVAICREAIARMPRSAQANHLCGRSLLAAGRPGEAMPYLEAAVAADAELAEAQFDLSRALSEAGDDTGAEGACRRALAVEPSEVRYRLQLVDILEKLGRKEDALAELSLAQEYAPDRFDLMLKLFRALDGLGMYEEALRIAERAVHENGESFETLSLLSFARYGVCDYEGAVEACRKTLAFRQESPNVLVTLGSSLYGLGRFDEAMSAYRRALKLKPDFADALFHIGLLNLARGKYREGWPDVDQRLKLEKNKGMRRPEPGWNGTSLRGRTLHVLREQGLGDEVMFASCFPQLIRDAGHCHIECEPRLEKLFVRSFPGATFYPVGDDRARQDELMARDFDACCYAASLPRYLRNSLADFPDHRGYLVADPVRIEHWRGRLRALGGGFKVGISWRGGTVFTHRERRSLTLDALQPVLDVPGIRWINLQYGKRDDEIAGLRARGTAIEDWPEAIDGDYDETAALVSALDLVVSVCTSVVHLAGALGKPVWVLVPYAPGWRYGLQGEGLPWYPAARVFRQGVLQSWNPVLERLAEALRHRVG